MRRVTARRKALYLCAGLALVIGCTPLIYSVNYRSIRGTVGSPLSVAPPGACENPRLITPAMLEGGGLPPGVQLLPDGLISGAPTEAGRWNVMIRLARMQCGDELYADDRASLHFEISPAPAAR